MKRNYFVFTVTVFLSVVMLCGCVFNPNHNVSAPIGKYKCVSYNGTDFGYLNEIYILTNDGILQADIPNPRERARYKLYDDGKLEIINSGDTAGAYGTWKWESGTDCIIFNDTMKFQRI